MSARDLRAAGLDVHFLQLDVTNKAGVVRVAPVVDEPAVDGGYLAR